MGAFGSTLGGIMTIGSLFIGATLVFSLTDNYYPLLWFILFGYLGGASLGALNSRKARTSARYKNEYMSYFGMFLAAIIFLAMWYWFFALDRIDKKISDDSVSDIEVLGIALGAGLAALFGLGLVIGNSLAESR